MNHSQIAQKYTADPEDRMLVSRVLDLANRAQSGSFYAFTDFLTPAQRGLLCTVREITALCELRFDGGYPDAERTIGILCPRDAGYEPVLPITVLELHTKGEPLSHRDILGALMALGIRREKLGDIIASANPPLMLCDEVIAPYLIEHLTRAGRNSVSLKPGTPGAIPPAKTVRKTATVMSLRADSVVAEGFGLSRTRAADLIRQGAVSLNWQPCASPSKSVAQGDRISARGFGKFLIAEIGGQSRKGRTFIALDVYV